MQRARTIPPNECRNGHAAQRPESCDVDILVLAKFDQAFLREVWVTLNLVADGFDASSLEQSLDLGRREV